MRATTQPGRYYVVRVDQKYWRVYKPNGESVEHDFRDEPAAAFWADEFNEAMRRGAIEQQKQSGTAVSDDLMQRVKESLRNAFDLLTDPVCASMPWRAKVAAWRHDARKLQTELYRAAISDTSPGPEPAMHRFHLELCTWLDQQTITGENIGGIRSQCFVPWDSTWNSIVREETAKREKFIPIVHIREKKESEPSPVPTVEKEPMPEPKRPIFSMPKVTRDLPKESLPEFGKEVKQQQPMTETEFPMKELVSWIVELHTTLLTNVGLTPGTRDALDKALLEYQKAAHEKGLL